MIKININSEYINFSGGAKGADSVWEEIGKEYNIGKQVNFRPEDLIKLSDKQLGEIEEAYKQCVKDLGRKFLNKDTYVGGLVRRDYLQVINAEKIFAIGTIVKPNEKGPDGFINNTKKSIISGGTGYAVNMGINLNKIVYVFDQTLNKWFETLYVKSIFDEIIFKQFVETDTPILSKKFAGVGTRKINKNGVIAIRNVYEKTFN